MQNQKNIYLIRKKYNNIEIDTEVEDILKDTTNTNIIDDVTNLEITKTIEDKTNTEISNITTKKIAFCFLITNIINHEELWYNFFKNIDHNKYNIYIHCKKEYHLKYFNKYVLSNSRMTQWGKISLVLASNILFREASTDINNYKFILLSGSCIPFKSFNYIYDLLTKDNYAYFNLYSFIEDDRSCMIEKYFNKKYIGKAHQWVILNRLIVNRILEYGDINIVKHFGTMKCPDEHVYITLVKYFNLENNIITFNNLSIGATTFTNWKTGFDHPEEYCNISIKEINNILNSKSLFGRKFNKYCTITETDENLNNYIKKYLKL